MIKMQPTVFYESRYNNMLLILLIFAIPINRMHKIEINSVAPIRLDQEVNRMILIGIFKKIGNMRYNTFIF